MSTERRHPHVAIGLLDGLTVRVGRRRVAVGSAEQRLLALLALRARPTARGIVAGTLWPDTSDDRSMGNLRSTLWRLRRCGFDAVDAVGDAIAFRRGVAVDLDAAKRAAEDLLGPGPTPHGVDDAITQLRGCGEVLPDWSDDWVTVERERFRQLRLHALECATQRLVDEGRFGRAVDLAIAVVADEPLRETAHRALIAAHVAEGNVVEARRAFRAYARLMRDELGIPPSARMRRLLADGAATTLERS
jgi:DNA-binding SARP family transcriptional activator